MWRLSSRSDPDRWVQYNPAGWTADEQTTPAMREYAGRPVQVAPVGDLYQPTGEHDPLGVYLLARYLVPGPHTVTGTPPPTPPAGQYTDGTVF